MKRSISAAAVALLVAGCSVTDPAAPTFSFSVTRKATMDFEAPQLRVSGGDGQVVVEGDTWTACAGGTLAGSLTRPNDSGLALVITEYQEGDACPGAVVPYDYRALLGQLEPGRYHLQILLRHARGFTPPRTIFHDFVRVQ